MVLRLLISRAMCMFILVALCLADMATVCEYNCIETYDPSCGSDGRTYLNNCVLDYANCGLPESDLIRFVHWGICKHDDKSLFQSFVTTPEN